MIERKTRTDHVLHQPDNLTCYLQDNRLKNGSADVSCSEISGMMSAFLCLEVLPVCQTADNVAIGARRH